jgi:hypothetical protein
VLAELERDIQKCGRIVRGHDELSINIKPEWKEVK